LAASGVCISCLLPAANHLLLKTLLAAFHHQQLSKHLTTDLYDFFDYYFTMGTTLFVSDLLPAICFLPLELFISYIRAISAIPFYYPLGIQKVSVR